MRAAAPERGHLLRGVAWLMLAAGLEALGPAIAKLLIDSYLLPRNAQIFEIVGLLIGALAAGMAASWLRYGQLVRLAGVAMRSVQRIREQVYRHVLRLPIFFDRAIAGKLVTGRQRHRSREDAVRTGAVRDARQPDRARRQ
jgi:ATP-binding cassette subfamily B protein/ATP-binding cassette subfamily C protein/ATP-binding cassette subfamily B multidrug efflux pump